MLNIGPHDSHVRCAPCGDHHLAQLRYDLRFGLRRAYHAESGRDDLARFSQRVPRAAAVNETAITIDSFERRHERDRFGVPTGWVIASSREDPARASLVT